MDNTLESTTSGFVRIMDANNTGIGDTSWVGFSITAVSLQLQEPKGGETFGQNETITIAWRQSLVTSLFVEYSTDGGTTWNLIRQVTSTQSATSGSTEWKPGTAQSPTVIIRVRTADNIILSQTTPINVAKKHLIYWNRQAEKHYVRASNMNYNGRLVTSVQKIPSHVW
ncbi:MAG: hypothetical protein IPK11_15910, partial [Ignavibacteria bacterium]|nr:hypothetical protein [Ignavibacteria bacterium]